jgi:hypothetical protein
MTKLLEISLSLGVSLGSDQSKISKSVLKMKFLEEDRLKRVLFQKTKLATMM